MSQQLFENFYFSICLNLDLGDREMAHNFLLDYGDAVDQDPELLQIMRERVYGATGEWLE